LVPDDDDDEKCARPLLGTKIIGVSC
jgi:hypothetical protein